MKTAGIILIIMIALYALYKIYSTTNVDNHLDQLLAKGAVILDVRTQTEYNGGHIKGAINIPLSALHTIPLTFDPKVPVITCCSHGLRSIRAVSVLKSRGFMNVHNGGVWTDLEQHIPHGNVVH